MKNILIIGGTRFLGPEIIKKNLRLGNKVTIFNRGTDYGRKIPEEVLSIKGNRLNKNNLRKLKDKKYDFIYDMCCYNPEEAELILKEVEPESNIIFLSSAAVYKRTKIFPLYESSELGPWSTFGDYGECKAKIEKIYTKYCKKKNLNLTILRPNYLLGKNNYFDRENYFFSRLLKDQPILIPGSGDSMQQFCFLEDTAKAFIKIPFTQKIQVEIVNIAGKDLISLRDFINICGEIVGKKPHLIKIFNGEFGIEEESFYDELYPFPNVTFITSAQKMTEVYKINPTPLLTGLKEIYKYWIKNWDGKVKFYRQEQKILHKIKAQKHE